MHDGVEGVIENHNRLVKTVTRRDDLICEMKVKITALEARAEHAETALKEGGVQRKEFHPDHTIVIENLPYVQTGGEEETEDDLHGDAQYIFGKCMGVDVDVVRVKRMSVRRNDTGVVKFEMANKAMVEAVLKNKYKLREDDHHPEVKSLWVRKSKSTERLIKEHNSDVLLKELNATERYRCLPNGRLVRNRGRHPYSSRK